MSVNICDSLGGKKYIIISIPRGSPPIIIKKDLFPNFDFELSDQYPTKGSEIASISLANKYAITRYSGFKRGTRNFSVAGGK